METNVLPKYDMSDNPTNCCPRFNPAGWDDQELHFKDKLFVKAKTRSLFHIPLNMGKVMEQTYSDMQRAHADTPENFIALSYDPSPWTGEHYFSVSKDVPEHEMVKLTGDFITKVFEGSYKNVSKWEKEMDTFARQKGKEAKKTYFFYTTCPKCAKAYGKNYVIGVSQI